MIIVINLATLNLCPSDDSNRIVVEMCSNIPTTNAVAYVKCVGLKENSLISMPKGAIKAKTNRIKKPLILLILLVNKRLANVIAIGTLCKTIPSNNELLPWSCP